MRTLCIGAGAIGGSVAARLARAGVDLTVVDADAGHVARMRDPGLAVGGLDGGAVTKLAAATPEDALAAPGEPVDLLLLAVRSHATEPALRPFAGRLSPGGSVVSLQNGLNEEPVSALVGAARTIGCVVGFGATWISPGEIELTSTGELVIGRLDGSTDPGLDAARDLLEHAFPTRVTGNILGALWGKMIVNSVTVLGAVGGVLTGELLSSPEFRPAIRAVVVEGIRVAAASGVRLDPVLGVVDPAQVLGRGADWEAALDGVLDLVAEHFGQVKSVTLRDFELGKRTEIDAVTGEIVRRGRRAGVETPVDARAFEMLREIASGARRSERANLADLAAAARRGAP